MRRVSFGPSIFRCMYLKGQCHEIFFFRFFSWITFPQAPENKSRVIRCTTGVNDNCGKCCHQFPLCCWHRGQICYRCQQYRRQIMGTISGCRHLKVNLKAKIYIYINSTTNRCPNKIINIFLLEALSREYLRCLGETNSLKQTEVENLVTLSL